MAAATLKMVTLDSSDARRDARFWSAVLAWDVVHGQDKYAMLSDPGGVAFGLGTIVDYEPGPWPNTHGSIDLSVDEVEADARCVELGATLPKEQPGKTWRVLLDPSGHPFCLTLAAIWA